jgi:methionyl-tRNA formyltransferase
MVVIAYGLILPKEVLFLTRFGAINIHASLLPRWRGASPIQSAILAGDQETGVTIMQIDEGLDTGDMLHKKVCKINPEDTAQDLHDRLAKLGKDALLETLTDLEKNRLNPEPQNDAKATYAKKILKEDALIDWSHTAWEISCQVRAFNPWPIAYTNFKGVVLRIWEAIVIHEKTEQSPGTVVNKTGHYLDIATGHEILRLTKVQLPGGKPMSISDFLNARQEQFVINETKLG